MDGLKIIYKDFIKYYRNPNLMNNNKFTAIKIYYKDVFRAYLELNNEKYETINNEIFKIRFFGKCIIIENTKSRPKIPFILLNSRYPIEIPLTYS